ncbi:rhodanese-like domain-containing protein [Campylobacter sp. MG1]|uniref:rhodanese-like domain-containing protein n=1 Tax=Campylobacter sp. MG1 TaxID=2976332 RepID=UPI00226C7EC7|nr:rhodanese-like domain-containing protein [Campylobacter sp. MG1]
MNVDISAEKVDFSKHKIIDIRTDEEHNVAYLENSILYPMDFNNLTQKDIDIFLDKFKNDENLVIMCRSGARSAMLCDIINKDKIIIKNLYGGIIAMAKLHPNKIIYKN